MEEKYPNAVALRKYEGLTVITEQIAADMINNLWKDAPAKEKLKAAVLCHQYNLNPYMKHLYIIKFDRYKSGQKVGEDYEVVQSIDATRLVAHRRHRFTYLDMTPRIATKVELDKILGDSAEPGAVYFITRIKDLDDGTEGYGLGSNPCPLYYLH